MDLRETGSTLDRRRPPGRLLRTMRQPSSPRRRAGRAPAPARADADRRASPGDRRARPRGGTSTPGRAWSTRCWPTSRASPALSRCSPTPSTSRGPAATVGSSPGGLPCGRRCARGDRAHGRGRLRGLQPSTEQVLMRRMFLQLTELGETTEDTRQAGPAGGADPGGRGGEEATAVLEQLAAARLLVVGDDSAEIAHEALIREWPRLRGWLAEDREELRAAPAADDRGALLGGERTRRRRSLPWPRLAAAVELRRRRAPALAASSASSSRRARTPRSAS